jgi:hypothetical protein
MRHEGARVNAEWSWSRPSAAGYYKRNNMYSNLRITYKIKHTLILQNEAD